MPRSSQFDLPGGCVEMTISFGPNVRTASSTATSGSPSPTSPRASIPTDDEARERDVEPLLRRLARRILVRRERLQAGVERGADDEELRLLDQRERADGAQELLALDRLVGDDEDAALVRPAEAPTCSRSGAGPRWRR